MSHSIKAFISICLFTCTILTQEVTRVIQKSPQLVQEITSYEWCTNQPKTLSLVKRTFWLFDHKNSTRNEHTDTPSSRSQVLWSNNVEN